MTVNLTHNVGGFLIGYPLRLTYGREAQQAVCMIMIGCNKDGVKDEELNRSFLAY